MATSFELSRLGIDVNLPTGSSYDLLVVSTPEGYPQGRVLFKFETASRKITGIQKLAQLFMKALFTTKGTDLLNPNQGTGFSELWAGANLQFDDSEIRTLISDAVDDAASQVKYAMNGDAYDLASQLDRVEILGFDSSIESISLYIWMVTLAGETASVAIPFPQLDMTLNG